MILSMSEKVEVKELTKHDRCDRCGAAAKVRVLIGENKSELLFCSHHMRAVEANLPKSAIFDPDWDDVSQY
jgi:hypothetical protein